MTRNEALKRWKQQLEILRNINREKPKAEVNFNMESWLKFVEMLDALIAPEEHAQKTAENRHVPETCTEKAEKSTDDLWLEALAS